MPAAPCADALFNAGMFKKADEIISNSWGLDQHTDFAIERCIGRISGKPVQTGDCKSVIIPSQHLSVNSGLVNRPDRQALFGKFTGEISSG